MHPLFAVLQQYESFAGDHCCTKQWKHAWYPALQSYWNVSGTGGTPEGGSPEGGGSSEGQPRWTVLQQ